jgi:hypothetical protein
MTLEFLERQVEEARANAVNYAERCEQLVSLGDLAAAIAVCNELSIEPPQCSLTVTSENAQKLRTAAARKLSDPKWWIKALETQAIRRYEHQQMVQGKVSNFVSDGLAAYHAKHKAKR